MDDREEWELALVNAQVALAIKQSQTEFWKVGLVAVAVTAAVVQAANLIFGA